jgi:hypothetical protein
MRPDHKRSLTFFLFALPIVVIVMVMVFGGSVDPVAKWLEKWATLIAGLLAVAAALATVQQMQASDEGQERRFREAEARQEDRHRQLVQLTVVGTQLRMGRAALHARGIQAMTRARPRWDVDVVLPSDADSIEMKATEFAVKCRVWIDRLTMAISDRSIVEASAHFDVPAFGYLTLVQSVGRQLDEDLKRLKRELDAENVDLDRVIKFANAVSAYAVDYTDQVTKFEKEVARLADQSV